MYTKNVKEIAKNFGVDLSSGLDEKQVNLNRQKYGENILKQKKSKSVINRIISALFEPMMIILLVAFFITLGVNIGKLIKGATFDFYECIGILIAITISTSLTVIMENKSAKAFEALKKLGDKSLVKVLRCGKIDFISKENVVVGDLVYLESGNKVPCDGRLIESVNLSVDESTLTGESVGAKKDYKKILQKNCPLAERVNMVYGGSYILEGTCKYIVTSVGDSGEIGKIASELNEDKKVSPPLEEKLNKLGKTVSIFGGICSAFVFILSLVRLIAIGEVSFDNVQNIFIESIVLIVVAVPEGLPTTVAISLTLNLLKLAKSNALIKKLVATETVGCVSVICSDKTGTLTENKMSVKKIVTTNNSYDSEHIVDEFITLNCAINSTAEIVDDKSIGSQTECALLMGLKSSGVDYKKLRNNCKILDVTPFNSTIKYMLTKISYKDKIFEFIKGAPEIVLEKCILSKKQKESLQKDILVESENGGRIIAFAHSEGGAFIYDGFAVIFDSLRGDVVSAILTCKNAGIKVKMLTGDNLQTAKYIGYECGLDVSGNNALSADYIDSLTDTELMKILPNVTVIARSTPKTKLRVVSLLQKLGEVVAVTGDGVNDAPAIRHADIGICMGDGSEITKKASDVVLLDNSFSTILKAITFGRNVYANFQRFISFQLTVNLSSMTLIIINLIMGYDSPFTSSYLLWLNVIMDGPLALSLGLEMRDKKYLEYKPIKRSDSILSKKMLIKIGVNSLFCSLVITLQQVYNFLDCDIASGKTVILTLFVLFQVFNSINCRELTRQSSFIGILSNKLLIVMISVTIILQMLIVEFIPSFFGTTPLDFVTWVKCFSVSLSIVLFNELYKLIYRAINTRPNKLKVAKNV